MWAKIKIVPCDQKIIYLPPSLAIDYGPNAKIIFGGKSTSAIIQYQDELESASENSFETPATIPFSDKLSDDLTNLSNKNHEFPHRYRSGYRANAWRCHSSL